MAKHPVNKRVYLTEEYSDYLNEIALASDVAVNQLIVGAIEKVYPLKNRERAMKNAMKRKEAGSSTTSSCVRPRAQKNGVNVPFSALNIEEQNSMLMRFYIDVSTALNRILPKDAAIPEKEVSAGEEEVVIDEYVEPKEPASGLAAHLKRQAEKRLAEVNHILKLAKSSEEHRLDRDEYFKLIEEQSRLRSQVGHN